MFMNMDTVDEIWDILQFFASQPAENVNSLYDSDTVPVLQVKFYVFDDFVAVILRQRMFHGDGEGDQLSKSSMK